MGTDTYWTAASDEFCRWLNLQAPRKPKLGQVDFFRVHAFALDRLYDVLERLLPSGDLADDGDALAWRAVDPETGAAIAVSFSGRWQNATTGVGGEDLVSLVAHLTGARQIDAARALAAWLGIDPIRHV